jgi:1-acyl-sn-glycerol-3-phosphate acyltransferase
MNSNQVTPTSYPIQYKGSSIARYLLKLLGWKLYFPGLPAAHGVIVVYPHTSNWDFCIGILAKWGMGIQPHFLAKDSLFEIPLLGAWLRYLGGRPVIRNSPQGYVDQISKEMLSEPLFWALITPEGTRKHTPAWKSGFYRLALKAQVPIGMAFIDYGKKEIGMQHYFELTGDEEADLNTLRKEYEGRLGFYPQKMAPIVFGKK